MSHTRAHMETEWQESPDAIRRQREALAAPLAELLRRLRRDPPNFVLTCARGSSAHAATFGKHLVERHLGIPVGAFAPNIATIYQQRLKLSGQLFLTVSQSGKSDDLVEAVAMAKAAGALTATIVNDTESPLARASDIVLPMAAGPELSVAATKTFVTSLSAWLHLVAGWAELDALRGAIERLPDRLAAAMRLDWSPALQALSEATSLVSLGRGPTLAIAREAALKLKETSNFHAEAFSGAEFVHGPIALIEASYPVLLFMPTDQAADGLRVLAADLRRKNANVFMTDNGGHQDLPALAPDHPDTDAVCLIQSFYPLAIARGATSRHRRRPAAAPAKGNADQMSKPPLHAIAADHVFDGTDVRERTAVIVDGTRIADLVPTADLPRTISTRALPEGAWLAPGFIDLQVNGGGDVLFNDQPTVQGICSIAAAHRKSGTTGLLPTLITDSPDKMRLALDAADLAIGREPSVLGLHLEGPFLSPEKPGVHDPRHIRRPCPDDLAILTAPRQGVLLVTLAPEVVPPGFIAQLVAAGIRVSLGHSMASYLQTRAAMAEGLTGFTHLFNAMRPLTSREPGPIAQALESPAAWYGLIVDGVHVDPAMLRLALRGAGHPLLVTDAMPPVGGSRSTFTLHGETVTVRDGRCVTNDGTLAGADLDMATAVRNCVRLLGASLPDALRFASTNPAAFLGLGQVLGRLAPGYRADLVAFDPNDMTVLDTWVAGNGDH